MFDSFGIGDSVQPAYGFVTSYIDEDRLDINWCQDHNMKCAGNDIPWIEDVAIHLHEGDVVGRCGVSHSSRFLISDSLETLFLDIWVIPLVALPSYK